MQKPGHARTAIRANRKLLGDSVEIVRGGLNARVTVEARTIVRGPRRPLVPAPTMGAYDAALATSHALGGVRRLELTSLTIPDCVLLVTASC